MVLPGYISFVEYGTKFRSNADVASLFGPARYGFCNWWVLMILIAPVGRECMSIRLYISAALAPDKPDDLTHLVEKMRMSNQRIRKVVLAKYPKT